MNKETMIQTAIMQYLALLERAGVGYFFRNNVYQGEIYKRGRVVGYMKNDKRGSPDIVGCYKGQFIGIEVKTETGRLSPFQKEAQLRIEKAGGRYIVARSSDDIVSELPLVQESSW